MLIRATLPDLDLEDMLPAIDDVIYEGHGEWPEQYTEVFNVMDSTRSIEQTTEVTGLSGFIVTPEGADATFDDPVPGFPKTYTHLQYSLGFRASKIMAMNNKFETIRRMARELGVSARDTREIIAADVFNQAFNVAFPGPDQVALCDLSHPLAKSGGTEQNRLTADADLSPTSLELALTDFRAFVDHTGKRKRIPPRTLLVAGNNEWNASTILGGSMASGTANRDINAFRNRSNLPGFRRWMVWDYLTDKDAWFLLSDKRDHQLRFYDREAFNTAHDIVFRSRTIETVGWMQFVAGFSNFWGVYGSPGV